MAMYVADAEGAIDKGVSTLAVADVQGSIDTDVQNGYVAAAEGGIDKLFYANWVLYSGTILNSSSSGGYVSSVAALTPAAKSFDVKPVHIEASVQAQAIETGETETLKLEVEYLNDSDEWVSINSVNKTVGNSYSAISLDFDVAEEIVTRQLRYRLIMLSGGTAEFSSFTGKCTQWWQKG